MISPRVTNYYMKLLVLRHHFSTGTSLIDVKSSNMLQIVYLTSYNESYDIKYFIQFNCLFRLPLEKALFFVLLA